LDRSDATTHARAWWAYLDSTDTHRGHDGVLADETTRALRAGLSRVANAAWRRPGRTGEGGALHRALPRDEENSPSPGSVDESPGRRPVVTAG